MRVDDLFCAAKRGAQAARGGRLAYLACGYSERFFSRRGDWRAAGPRRCRFKTPCTALTGSRSHCNPASGTDSGVIRTRALCEELLKDRRLGRFWSKSARIPGKGSPAGDRSVRKCQVQDDVSDETSPCGVPKVHRGGNIRFLGFRLKSSTPRFSTDLS